MSNFLLHQFQQVRFICARKASANCVTLEIDKILIRSFSSQTKTTQKLLFFTFWHTFCLPAFFWFFEMGMGQAHSSAPRHKTQTISQDPTISRLKTTANRVDKNFHKYLINKCLY